MHFILYNKYLRYLYLLQVSIVCYIYIRIQFYWFLIVNVRVNCVSRCIYYDGICLLSRLICTSLYTKNIYDICICYSSLYLQNPRNISQSQQPNKRTLRQTHKKLFIDRSEWNVKKQGLKITFAKLGINNAKRYRCIKTGKWNRMKPKWPFWRKICSWLEIGFWTLTNYKNMSWNWQLIQPFVNRHNSCLPKIKR